MVERVGDRVRVVISAFSRPAAGYLRAAGPLGHLAQRAMTYRYLRALG